MLTIQQRDGQTLQLAGQLTSSEITEYWPQLKQHRCHSLQLGELARIDSAGIAAIITAFEPKPDAPLVLQGCSEQARSLIELYQLDALFVFS